MKKILLIIDAQNDFIDGALRNEDAINYAVPNIINKLKKHGSDYDVIVFTQDTHDKDYLTTKEGNKLPVEHCIFGTEGWQIHPEILKIGLEIKNNSNIKTKTRSVMKPTFGSFDLVDTFKLCFDPIKDKEVSIEVCGFCTDICVISNVLMLKAAFYNNSEITVDACCCAGVTPEKHNAALNVMESCQINIINKDKLINNYD